MIKLTFLTESRFCYKLPSISYRNDAPVNPARSLLAGLLLSFALLALPAAATLPDPVRFGVTLELGNVSQAKAWLDEGLPVDFLADRIGSGLMIGAWEGNIPLMELFLSRGARVDQENGRGEQALQFAAWQGHLEAVRWLLEHGAPVNRQGNAWSALHYAAFAGHNDILQLLLQRGADVNARAPNESTVLMMAVREGRQDTVQQLLAAGADTRLVNDRGDSALVWAMRNKHLAIAKLVAETPVRFAEAVKVPTETFGPPTRSEPAPQEVSEVLRQIRIARADGKNVDALEQALFAMADKLRRQVTQQKPQATPGALLITARRKHAGEEKAELVYPGGRPAEQAATPAVQVSGNAVSDILYRLRQAQAEGKPTDELRAALLQAVARMSQ